MKKIKYSLLALTVLFLVGSGFGISANGREVLVSASKSINDNQNFSTNKSEMLLVSDVSDSSSDSASESSDLYSGIDYRSPIKHSVLTELLAYLLQLLFWLGVTGMTLIVLYGAFQMIFSGGNPEKFSKGQKTIMYAILGLVLILLSRAIVAIIKSVLTPN